MDIVIKKIADIVPYYANPRIIPEEAVTEVSKSLKNHGVLQPIVIDKENVVVAGHTRLLAAKKLQLKEVPCVIYEGNEEKVNAYRIADNKTGEYSTWEEGTLDKELDKLIQKGVEVAGFYDTEQTEHELLEVDGMDINLDEVGYSASDLTNTVPLMFYLTPEERAEAMEKLENIRDQKGLLTKNNALLYALRQK
tara:strand:- start:725 stop:1306 length:582 start_codon:yes stop_codon:yes gene_type:complete